MIFYTDGGWPLWARVLVTVFAAGVVAAMGWRYYKRYWKH